MSASVNRVTLIGNLGKDPVITYTPSGMAVAKFPIATNERTKDKDGSWSERVEWHNIVAFDRKAEVAGEYLKKGRTVYIEGSIRANSWTDEDSGEKKYRTEILVNNLVLLGGRKDSGDGESEPASRPHESRVSDESPITDEDIPF